MDANQLLRASQKSPLRTIYGRSNRSLFAPINQQAQRSADRGAEYETQTYASPAPNRTPMAQEPHNGANVTLEQHYSSLSALDSRLQAIQERNDRLLGQVYAQQSQIEHLQNTLEKRERRIAMNDEHTNAALNNQTWASQREQIGAAQTWPVWQHAHCQPSHRPTKSSADRIALLALAVITIFLLLVVVVVLVVQWRGQNQKAARDWNENNNALRTRGDVERAVIDVLSRSLLSQNNGDSVNGNENRDALSGALLRSLMMPRRNLAQSQPSNALLYGP